MGQSSLDLIDSFFKDLSQNISETGSSTTIKIASIERSTSTLDIGTTFCRLVIF